MIVPSFIANGPIMNPKPRYEILEVAMKIAPVRKGVHPNSMNHFRSLLS